MLITNIAKSKHLHSGIFLNYKQNGTPLLLYVALPTGYSVVWNRVFFSFSQQKERTLKNKASIQGFNNFVIKSAPIARYCYVR